jgi:hypothetical protein
MLNVKKPKFPHKPIVSQKGKKFIEHLLEHNQDNRLDVEEACNHPYIKS